MRAQPKIKKIVNFIVAQTDCGVFVINAILNLSLNISKPEKFMTVVRFSAHFFFFI